MYVLPGVNELIHNIDIHKSAIQSFPNKLDLKVCVLECASKYLSFKMTSVGLAKHLREQRITCVRKVHTNCLPNRKLRTDPAMEKKDEGSSKLWIIENDGAELRAIKFLDKSVVSFVPYMNW